MGYNYDIFISYRRLGGTRSWIKEYFVPLLEDHLSLELGRNPKIFLDDKIETGDSWPNILGQAVSTSKVIIAVWTRTFLDSLWCTNEIGLMLEREKKYGFRSGTNPHGLVFPVVIHDGETMPIQISTIQKVEVQEFFKMTLNKDGQKYTEFEDRVKALVVKIGTALNSVPQWEQDWESGSVDSFVQQLHNKQSSFQMEPPKFTSI